MRKLGEGGQREVESQGEKRWWEGWRRRGEKKASKQRGEVVVLRSVRMSAFPLSGEGYHRLSMSVTPLVYSSLRGRGKGR